MSKKSMVRETRSRNWSVIVYPESAPGNWRNILDELHIEWVESPLHDKDLDPTNQPKKPHWHILLLFSGLKSYEQVLEICQELNCPIPERCHNTRSLIRYFAHLDNPDKFQYSKFDIVGHGGVDLDELFRPSKSEKYEFIGQMMDFCIENNITEFADLLLYAKNNESETWFPLLADSCTIVMQHFLSSLRYSRCKTENEKN